jgi:hypothetical protein
MSFATPSPQPRSARHAGPMTAVMRSLPEPRGPRILRVALAQAGRIVEERIFKQRTGVTIGSSAAAAFVVADAGLPAQWSLFELRAGDYYLNVRPGMTGRLALETGILDLANLSTLGPLRLTDDARGKVVLGDTTLLFQFVLAPPAPSKPKLPLAVTGGLASQIDWSLTIIAAFSFLLHFGVIGAMYADWMDTVVDTHAVASGVVEMLRINVPAPVEVPLDTVTPTQTLTPSATKEPVPAKGEPSKGTPKKLSATDAASLSAQAEHEIQMQMILSLDRGSSVRAALDRFDIPPVDLGKAAASDASVMTATGNSLNLGPGAGPIRPGEGHDLGRIGRMTGGEDRGPGKETSVVGPAVKVDIGETTPSVAIANAGTVVAGLRGGFRACYNAGLRVDSSMAGHVMLSVRIGPNGAVSSTTPSGNTGLSAGVVECLKTRVDNAQFDAPGPTGSTLQIPITFVQQGK